MGSMETTYRAVIQQRGEWWIGWIEEVPGVNSQGAARDELMDNLRSALEEAPEMNRADALAAAQGAPYEEVRVALAAPANAPANSSHGTLELRHRHEEWRRLS